MEDALPLYHSPQDSSRPGKTVLPWRQVNILAICTGLNHEFILSELVAVANTTDLLHLRTFPSVEDTLPLTLRFFNTWKNSSLMNSSQHSAHLHWINSWIETFWAHCSGKFTVWLHLDIFSPMEDALPQTTRLLDIWKAGFAIKASQHSGRLYWIKPRTDTFWVHYSTVIHGVAWLQLATFPPMEDALPWTTRPFNSWKISIAMNSSQYSHHFYWSSQVLHTFTAHFAIFCVFCVLILA